MSEIARQKKVSVSSIYRVLKRFYEPKKINRLTFRTYLTETKVVDRLLAYDDELKSGYTCYQDFLYAVQTRDFDRFHTLLDEDFRRLPSYYQKTIGTFKKYQNEIKNALELPYSNGLLECLNNHIKVLKRNAYGFRNFYNFKLRISLCFGTILFQENKKTRGKFL